MLHIDNHGNLSVSVSLSLSPISKHPFLFLLFVSVLYHLNPSYLFILGMPEGTKSYRKQSLVSHQDSNKYQMCVDADQTLRTWPHLAARRSSYSWATLPRSLEEVAVMSGQPTEKSGQLSRLQSNACPGDSRDKD